MELGISFTLIVLRVICSYSVLSAFWRGIGPALILVINPIIQYTVFEQLKNFLISRRTARLRASGAQTATATLSDWDFFLLGALSKLGMRFRRMIISFTF